MKEAALLALSEGMEIDQIQITETGLVVSVISTHPQSCCPLCSQPSSHIHSHYHRTLKDAPCVGRQLQLFLTVRKFFCRNPLCSRKVGKLGENSDANAGSRALCPNFRPKKVWLKIRTNFHVFGCFIIIYHFMVYKMCYRFPSVVSKLPLQKGDEPSGSSFVQPLNPKSDH